MDENNNNGRRPGSPGGPGSNNFRIFAIILAASLGLTFIMNIVSASTMYKKMSEIEYSTFLDFVEKGYVDEVEYSSDKLLVTVNKEGLEELGYVSEGTLIPETSAVLYVGYVNDDNLVQFLKENDVKFANPIDYTSPFVTFFAEWIFPLLSTIIIFTILTRLLMKRMGTGGMGKSAAKMYVQKETGVTFADVAGQDEAKESLEEIIDFLHNPEKYHKIGAKQPKGALLVGPPGTGKTLLAKAVAGEANVAFMSISGSDFEEVFVGVGASRVRDLFKSAQQNAPCIVFIDELDAVGHKRDDNINKNDQTLNQLLSEMDGFDSSKGVVILGATNRPEVLDKALLRPGRFDRRIIVETPDLKGREDILKVHAKNVKMGSDVDLHKLALATSGASGADLANMINEAALRAVRFNRNVVIQEDLLDAVEVVFAGKEKKNRIINDKEKIIVAFHEVGHAFATALQKHTQPVQKITIVPRTGGALGFTMQMPEEERSLMSKDEILDEITVLLAGRSAEEIEFGSVTTGASNDIERATQLARNMISIYGMSDRFDMMGLESIQNKYLDGRAVATCGEQTIAEMDKEVLSTIKTCHEKAKNLLSENHTALTKISEYLIEKENISGEEFMSIFNKVQDEEKAAKKAEETTAETTETAEQSESTETNE
ncbi:MAG: ATP-dependent zinc metalloprotease FtsH [Clostridiales bacterium]|nr:ATP-dependent zinc metalloprotease FtsH [Clostridiales bacterium]